MLRRAGLLVSFLMRQVVLLKLSEHHVKTYAFYAHYGSQHPGSHFGTISKIIKLIPWSIRRRMPVTQ